MPLTSAALRAGVLAALLLAGGCSPEPAGRPAGPAAPPLAGPVVVQNPVASTVPLRVDGGLKALPVRLLGSVLGADPARSTALVSVGDSPARELKVGDSVAPGVTLAVIQPDSVTLKSGDERRVVGLEARKPAAGGAPAVPPGPQGVGLPPPGMAPAPATQPAPGAENIEDAFKRALKAQQATKP